MSKAQSETARDRLIKRSAKENGASRTDSLIGLLEAIDAPPQLPGLKQIAQNILEILDSKAGISFDAIAPAQLSSWQAELRWIGQLPEDTEKDLFDKKSERKRFSRKNGNGRVNPVRTKAAQSNPLYCQLWESHPDPECNRGFRILQGHAFLAHREIRPKIEAQYEIKDSHRKTATAHLYRTTFPLQEIAHSPLNSAQSLLKATIKFAPDPRAFVNQIAARRDDLPRRQKSEGKQKKEKPSLREYVSDFVSLLKWRLSGTYQPEPRSEEEPAGQGSKKAADGPRHPPESERGASPEAKFQIREESFDDDDSDDSDVRESSGDGIPRRRSTGITRYVRSRRDRTMEEKILATGDHPGNYTSSSTIDLAKNARGVRLNTGGWQEMQNQYLPWSMNELAIEELADAWLRLERQAASDEPESVELFALFNALLWTGRLPKDIFSLELLPQDGDPAGAVGFALPLEPCIPSTAEWRIRALTLPELKTPAPPFGFARNIVPVFSLPDFSGVETVLRKHIGSRVQPSSASPSRVFLKEDSYYKDRLAHQLAPRVNELMLNSLQRVTLKRVGYMLFQRIIDVTGGDLVAASFITGRDLVIARDDRFYASPSIESLRKIYRLAVAELQNDLVALGCPIKEHGIVESTTTGKCVGSVLCPSVQCVQQALGKLKEVIRTAPVERVDLERDKIYTLYSVMLVGWAVGFRAIEDPFIYPEEIDRVEGLTAFQDKGPEDRSKSRLMRIPGLALAQIDAYEEYLDHHSFVNRQEWGMGAHFATGEKLLPMGLKIEFEPVRPSLIEALSRKYQFPLPANAARHFARTEWIERGINPEYVAGWLGHFFRGEEPWGKFSTFQFKQYCHFMKEDMPNILRDLGYRAFNHDGTERAEVEENVERLRELQSVGLTSPRD